MISRLLTLVLLLAAGDVAPLEGQQPAGPGGRLLVRVHDTGGDPVAGAEVRAGEVRASTDATGLAVLQLPPGTATVRVTAEGYGQAQARARVVAGGETALEIELGPPAEEIEGLVVVSTRTGQRIEDVPTRVEVLAREEVEEKMLMTPGDISMMLNETSGLRVQSTSPALGGASIRVQGLRGRYTQLLADGLPLYGGQSGALGLLQIPPMDLAQVEVIKGGASALYGPTALGGVINLISRRPAGDREILLNRTSRGGTDGILWLSSEGSGRWGSTLLASVHGQGRVDVDDDGWADQPGYARAVARPRVFWDDGAGRSIFLTAGATVENRAGGTLPGRRLPHGSVRREALETRRGDAGLVARALLAADRLVSARGSFMLQRHRHRFGPIVERDVHVTGFAEATLSGSDAGHAWVLGAAFQQDTYDARDVVGFDFTHAVPGIFAQDEFSPAEWLAISSSARLDFHSEYGTLFNPRVSVLLRPSLAWTLRASGGTAAFAPTPFTEETEAVGLAMVAPLHGLRAERARSVSVDLGRAAGELEMNATVFASWIEHPLAARPREGGGLELFNAAAPTRTRGVELLARWHAEPFHVTATHSLLRSTEAVPGWPGARREVPLTPRHSSGVVVMWEAEGVGRAGLEIYHTGPQRLEDDPYRERTPGYFVLGSLVERRLGSARLFLNAENLLDVRQTRYDPLLLPARSPEGRWTTDVWAPLEGRVFNAGVRYEF